MRITEKNTPILRLLKQNKDLVRADDEYGLLEKFFLKESDVLNGEETKRDRARLSLLLRQYGTRWKRFCDIFGKEISIVSKPFADAAEKNSEKTLTPVTTAEILKDCVAGTLIYRNGSISYFIIKKDGEPVDAFLIVFIDKSLVYMCHPSLGEFISGIYKQKCKEPYMEPKQFYMLTVLFFIAFRRYAEVDVLDAKPFKKVELPGEDDIKDRTLLVDSYLPVKYYDCSWFRTIVRKEGFMVRGHFRMQPYKNEKREWDLKLIYIEPFQKHGYTRTAKKVVEARKHNGES